MGVLAMTGRPMGQSEGCQIKALYQASARQSAL